MRSFSAKLGAALACAASLYSSTGCGGSSANFYDSPSGAAGRASSAAGAPGSSGGSTSGGSTSGGSTSGGSTSGGAANAAGSSPVGIGGQSAGGAGAPSNPSNAPCSPVKDVTGGMSGVLGTTGAVCLRVTGDITGWGCSNFDGRTVTVNGQPVMCAESPLPSPIAGAYYFDISAGSFDYASFYWF